MCDQFEWVASYVVPFNLHKAFLSVLKPYPVTIMSPPRPFEGPLLGVALATL